MSCRTAVAVPQGAAYHAGAPLYNRFVYYELVDSGTGVRRKATGLQMTHFLRMCEV